MEIDIETRLFFEKESVRKDLNSLLGFLLDEPLTASFPISFRQDEERRAVSAYYRLQKMPDGKRPRMYGDVIMIDIDLERKKRELLKELLEKYPKPE